MRLWHQSLIPYLPRQQLLGQHRECCALRGLGWGKKHATVDYVFQHPYGWLVAYHFHVMCEMVERGYQPDSYWWDRGYRGEKAPHLDDEQSAKARTDFDNVYQKVTCGRLCSPIYPEHDDAYLQSCLDNLARKGIIISMKEARP